MAGILTAAPTGSCFCHWQIRELPPLSIKRNAGDFIMSMADRDGFIWYDGKMVPCGDATTHVPDPFTALRAVGVRRREGIQHRQRHGESSAREHTQRLINSGKIYLMNLAYPSSS